jgi:GNAT superfamily N-acetyltransferase
MSIEIVPALTADASRLTAITIAAKAHWGYPERWMQIWTPMLTITPAYIHSHETWTARVTDGIVAYYSFRQDDELWLDNLWVLPEYMGHGIGRGLFGHALQRAQAREAGHLKIEADPNAVSFYERMGAHKVGELQGEVDGQPRILPVLQIELQ